MVEAGLVKALGVPETVTGEFTLLSFEGFSARRRLPAPGPKRTNCYTGNHIGKVRCAEKPDDKDLF